MNKLTKILAILLAAILLAGAAACSGTTTPPQGNTPGPSSSETEKPSGDTPATDAPATNAPATNAPATKTPDPPAAPGSSSGCGFNINLEYVGTTETMVLGGAFVQNEDDTWSLVDALGNKKLDRTFDHWEGFMADGLGMYYLVYDFTNEPNSVGLVSPDLELLIPCEAAIIDDHPGILGERYLEVAYATEEVTSQSDAYLYIKSEAIQFTPREGDTLYDGYSLYYDLELRRFVPDVKNELAGNTLKPVGENLFDSRNDTLYSPDGNVIAHPDYSAYLDYFVNHDYDTDKYIIYDSDLQRVAEVDFEPESVYGADLISTRAGESYESGYMIVDGKGSRIGELTFKYSPDFENGIFYQRSANDGDLTVAMDAKGNTIFSEEDNVQYINDFGRSFGSSFGMLVVDYSGSYEQRIIFPDGTISEKMEDHLTSADCKRFFILSRNDYSEEFKEVNIIDPFFAQVSMAGSDGYCLYSVLDGAKLLQGEYKDIRLFNGYIFAETDAGYEVYKVTVS